MPVHVAVVIEMYERLILGGHKTVECRLTHQPREPFGVIAPGERIYFKRSGGPFFALAVVDRLWTTDNLTPELIDSLRRQFNKLIHGTPEYWKARRDCRYATLAWLRDVQPTTLHPRYSPQNMRAWYTLPESAAPCPLVAPGGSRGVTAFEVTLTHGAIKNRYVRTTHLTASGPITLKLDRGPTITTELDKKSMLRWRGWKSWFESNAVKPGYRLRFTPDGPRMFAVTVIKT